MSRGSHGPSARLGACSGCAAGDHAVCDVISNPNADCTCYDDSWEWHEQVGSRVTIVSLDDAE